MAIKYFKDSRVRKYTASELRAKPLNYLKRHEDDVSSLYQRKVTAELRHYIKMVLRIIVEKEFKQGLASRRGMILKYY